MATLPIVSKTVNLDRTDLVYVNSVRRAHMDLVERRIALNLCPIPACGRRLNADLSCPEPGCAWNGPLPDARDPWTWKRG